jgi:hypothetical protein
MEIHLQAKLAPLRRRNKARNMMGSGSYSAAGSFLDWS